MDPTIKRLVAQLQLPESFAATVSTWYMPVASDLAKLVQARNETLVLGVQGCQGCGKSTLSAFLKAILENYHGMATTVVSIDDFYLTKAQRAELAAKVHPLLATRGVPGTHDTQLALDTLMKLRQLPAGERTAIPRFNKANDDRAPVDSWDEATGPVKVLIFEGWCVGLDAEPEAQLKVSVNQLERSEDADGSWRRYVNACLKNDYAQLFSLLDYLLVLKPPSFDCVYRWRLLQEEKLKKQLGDARYTGVMSPEQVQRFISHYQRLTEHGIQQLPQKADWLLTVEEDHNISALTRQHAIQGWT